MFKTNVKYDIVLPMNDLINDFFCFLKLLSEQPFMDHIFIFHASRHIPKQ